MTAYSKTINDLNPLSTMPQQGSQYPYNHMVLYDDGTEVHVDTTPGKERLRIAHGQNGTYVEINADGRRVDFVSNRHNYYVKGGLAQTVDGNVNKKTGGSERVSTQGDLHEEVQGRHSNFVGGDRSSVIGGDHNSAVGGDATHGITGKHIMKVGGGQQLKFDGDDSNQTTVNVICDCNSNTQYGKNMGIFIQGAGQVNSVGNFTLNSASQVLIQSGQSTVTITPGMITVQSSGPVNIKGSPVQINGGGSLSVPPFITPGATFPGG